jgi:Tol biopolymer transport system component
MNMDRRTAFRFLSGGFLLVILFSTMGCNRSPSARMGSVAVSPDGGLLAIDFGDDSTSFIYKIDVQSGNATRLTDAKVGRESGPAFSPDGKRISYSYSPGKGQPSSVVIENVDGSNLHSWPPSGGNDYWPVFSLDGKTAIFARSAYYGNYSPIAQPHPPMVGTCMQPIQTAQACASSRMKGFIQHLPSPCRPTARAWCL